MLFIKYLLVFFLTLFFQSCTLKKIDNVHGISNLKEKISLVKIKKSNKNDIIRAIGPLFINQQSDNKWTYFEVRETRTKYGKKKIYTNNYVEIFFNKYGIVNKIDFYNLSSMNKITFTKDKTQTIAKRDTISENLLSSTRKRMENAKKKFD